MANVHPTAIVSLQAELDASVEVGPGAIIDGPCQIGSGTTIGPRAYIGPFTTLGRDNRVHLGAVIGHVPQDIRFTGAESYCRVGDRNTFREYCQVHRSSVPGGTTTIGNDCFLMAVSHVGHDCTLGDHVIMANNALLAGHVEVHDRAFLSGNAVVHQFARVGKIVIVGGGSRVNQDVPPYMMVVGDSQVVGVNRVGLQRAGLDEAAQRAILQAYRLLYRSGLPFPEACDRIEAEVDDTSIIRDLLAFCRAETRRGLMRHA